MARKRSTAIGEFIRNQREIARLSMRQFATLAKISNPYLSQLERGLYQPSADVLKAIAAALGMPPERLYQAAGWFEPEEGDEHDVETAIRTDSRLTDSQKQALLAVYRGFLEETEK